MDRYIGLIFSLFVGLIYLTRIAFGLSTKDEVEDLVFDEVEDEAGLHQAVWVFWWSRTSRSLLREAWRLREREERVRRIWGN